jgi:hypothetical protein
VDHFEKCRAYGESKVGWGGAVTSRGICWGTTDNPTIFDNKTSVGAGAYSSSFFGIAPNTMYHARPCATNTVGTAYGSDLVFVNLGTDPRKSKVDFDGDDFEDIYWRQTITGQNFAWLMGNVSGEVSSLTSALVFSRRQ